MAAQSPVRNGPYAWAVSKKKPDFIGKRSFARSEHQNPLRKQLVGLLPTERRTRQP